MIDSKKGEWGGGYIDRKWIENEEFDISINKPRVLFIICLSL